MREATIQALIRQAVCRDGRAIVVRNTIGFCEHCHVTYGLGTGSADLVGILLGSGRVFCLEVKRPGPDRTAPKRRALQKAWARGVRARGGFCTTVTSVEEAMAALGRAVAGALQ